MRRVISYIFTLNFLMLFNLGFAQSDFQIAQTHIEENKNQFRLSDQDIADYVISSSHLSKRSQITHFYLQQQYQGIPIYQAVASVHIMGNDEVLRYNNQFQREITTRTNTTSPALTAVEAIQAAANTLGYTPTEPLQILENIGGAIQKMIVSRGGFSEEDIPVQLMYQVVDNQLRLAWDLSIAELGYQNWWSVRIDAQTGELLDQFNWTLHCDFGKPEMNECEDHVHTSTCGSHQHIAHSNASNVSSLVPNSYNVYDYPVESPIHGGRTLVVDPADAVASPFGWHDTDGSAGAEYTITRGNNVHAQEDRNANNGTGYSPDGGVDLEFDFPLDLSLTPQDNEDAMITNLFYWNNLMHDVWYQYGFDEASGNFQDNNYGNGGVQDDYVFADAQDGSGTNNANFSTPTDGGNPRMQMFLWSATSNTDFSVNSPSAISGSYTSVVANFGSNNFDVTGDLVIVDDGTGSGSEGCNALVNGADLNGNIALIDRGNCEFGTKVLNAENAGAIAAIVCQNTTDAPFAMGAGANGGSVTIPSIMISQSDCATIRAEIPTVNVTMLSTGSVQPDGDIDNGIIAHEYGHGISIRLSGGADNSGCLSSSEQMGEGWSDWFGLMMTIEPGDLGTDRRGIGTYALGQPTTGNGIRTYPYSTDMGINPHTYNDISGESVPHGVGSVWCAMLWDLAWLFIDQYGFDPDITNGTGGNNRAMAIVTEALKLQSCSTGFIDGRDAILAANQAMYGGDGECLIWEAFAKRGLGFGASQGSSNDTGDGTESFDLPASCSVNFEKTADVTNVAPGGIITYTLTVTNTTGGTITGVTITDDLPANTTYVPSSASDGGTESGGTVTFPAVTMNANDVITRTFSVQVDGNLAGGSYSVLDDVESGNAYWTESATNAGLGIWSITNTSSNSASNSWFAPDNDSNNEQYLTLSAFISPSGTTELSFFHLYDTENNWDGGRVQISTNGTSWTDLGSLMTQNGYNGVVDNSTPAFSGNSGGFIETIVDLSSYAGQNILIRFWMHCDVTIGGNGWYIDDVTINGLQVVIPNTANVVTNEGFNVDGILLNPTILDEAPDCEPVKDYAGSVTSGTYQTSTLITSDGIIDGSSNVQFLSSTIELEPGFEVQIGGEFLADIDPCTAFTNTDGTYARIVQEGILVELAIDKATKMGQLNYLLDKEVQLFLQSATDNSIKEIKIDNEKKSNAQPKLIDFNGFTSGTYHLIVKTMEEQYVVSVVIE